MVNSQTGASADFPRYRTYQWLPPRVLTGTGLSEHHPVCPLIKDAVNRHLQLRGLFEVASGGDLQISTWVVTEPIPRLDKAFFAGGRDNVYATPIATIGGDNGERTLVVNLIDAQSRKSAWSAVATESIPDNDVMTPDEARKKLDTAAQKLFSKYPVKSKR